MGDVGAPGGVGREEWFRRTTWDADALAEFLKRNKRSRGDASKAQYVYLQAVTLSSTGDASLAAAAYELLRDHFFPLYEATLHASPAHWCAGLCLEGLGDHEAAIAHYRKAVVIERSKPGMNSNAAFDFARLVVEQSNEGLYDEAVQGVDEHGPSPFPIHAYITNGVRAARAQRDGQRSRARELAKAALESGAIDDTGLSHGRGDLGTVRDTNSRFHALILQLANL